MIYQPEAAVRKEEKRKSNWSKINVGPALSRLNLAGEEGRCWPWISWWEPPRPAWWSARPPAPARWGPGGRRPSRRGPRWSRGWSRRTGRRRRWWGGEWESEKSENILCSQQIFSQQLLFRSGTRQTERRDTFIAQSYAEIEKIFFVYSEEKLMWVTVRNRDGSELHLSMGRAQGKDWRVMRAIDIQHRREAMSSRGWRVGRFRLLLGLRVEELVPVGRDVRGGYTTQSNNPIRCFLTSLLLFPYHALITNGKRKKLCQVRPVSNNNIVSSYFYRTTDLGHRGQVRP